MGCNCLPINLNRFDSVVRKNLGYLRSPSCFSIRNRDLSYWVFLSWRFTKYDRVNCYSRTSRFRCGRTYGTHFRNHRRHCSSSRTWAISRIFRCCLGAFISCRSVTRWILFRSRNNPWNYRVALDFLH